MDAEILSLLVPATLAVFLDPAMALIDTGTLCRITLSSNTAVHVQCRVTSTLCSGNYHACTTVELAAKLAIDSFAPLLLMPTVPCRGSQRLQRMYLQVLCSIPNMLSSYVEQCLSLDCSRWN